MKKIVLFVLSCLLVVNASAQNEKRFDYEQSQFGSFIVTPVFDQTEGQGDRGQASWSDKCYVNDLIYGIIKEAVPHETLMAIHQKSSVIITFNTKGEILKCVFVLDTLDIDIISEDHLYGLYLKFKQAKIDTTKIRITSGNYPGLEKRFDFAEIVGSLKPEEFRDLSPRNK